MHPTKPAQLLDHKAAERLNLAVLKRIDLATEEVLASANHVALYDFDQNSNQWERKEVEGSLFLIRRNEEPCIQIIILNKKSTHNYVEDVHPGFQFEKSRPYLLYRNKDEEVVGIWFYEADEADKVEHLLHQVTAAHVAHADQRAPAPQEASPVAANCSEDGTFWDHRAASPPPDFDPFGRKSFEEQQQPLQPHQQQQPAKPQHRHAPLVGVRDSLLSRGHQHTEEQGSFQVQQQHLQQPAAGMCCSILPMPQAGMPPKEVSALGGTPSRLASGPLKGVNVLRQGSVMTPEQCNLAKLLSNMRVASAGSPNGEGPPQSQPPQGSSAEAAEVQDARALSMPRQPPSSYQSGVVEFPLAQDFEENASLVASRPVLLTPKFLAGNQQQQEMLACSHAGSNAALHLSVKRTTSEPLFVPGLHTDEAEVASGTSLHRFFARAGNSVSASTEAITVREEEVGGVREKLRAALVSLSKSDAFLDLLAQELQAAGIMQL